MSRRLSFWYLFLLPLLLADMRMYFFLCAAVNTVLNALLWFGEHQELSFGLIDI